VPTSLMRAAPASPLRSRIVAFAPACVRSRTQAAPSPDAPPLTSTLLLRKSMLSHYLSSLGKMLHCFPRNIYIFMIPLQKRDLQVGCGARPRTLHLADCPGECYILDVIPHGSLKCGRNNKILINSGH